MRLQGKVAVITGAGSGLGRESALLFSQEGASVVVGDIDVERAQRTAGDIEAAGGTALAVAVDVSREAEVQGLVASARDRFGKLDVMFNNAGIPVAGNGKLEIHEITEQQWQRQIGVNLSGVFYGIKHAALLMRAAGGGSIINTASASAHVAFPGWAIYAAAKAGVVGMTRGAAIDLGKYGIRVNALTPMTGMSANFLMPPGAALVGEYETQAPWDPAQTAMPLKLPRPPLLIDHARLALFLASDEAIYMSGQAISIDGAQLARVGSQLAPVAEMADVTPR